MNHGAPWSGNREQSGGTDGLSRHRQETVKSLTWKVGTFSPVLDVFTGTMRGEFFLK